MFDGAGDDGGDKKLININDLMKNLSPLLLYLTYCKH
jgi:hypothetical protein